MKNVRVVVAIKAVGGSEGGKGAPYRRGRWEECPEARPSKKATLRHPYDTTVALLPLKVMKESIMTSEVQTERSVRVVLANEELKTLRALVESGCQMLALFAMLVGNKSPKNMYPPHGGAYSKLTTRRLCRRVDERMDVNIQFTGVVDGTVSLSRVAQYGMSPYIVPTLPWDMVLGHSWGYEHCVSLFAGFNGLYSHHPVQPRLQIEEFDEAPGTGEPFFGRTDSWYSVTSVIVGRNASNP